MKFSFPLFTVFNTILGSSANSAPVTDLDIQVTCANLRFNEISPKALAFGAKALEVTFNNVHKKADGLSLNQVMATPNDVSFARKQKVVGKTGLRAGCKFCGSDDEFGALESLSFAAKGTDDNLKCKFCGSDDDVTLDDAKLKLWEGELTAILALSPYASLSKAEDCRIAIAPLAAAPVEVGCKFCGSDDDKEMQQAVTIDVQCDKMDFSSAPVRVLSVASKLLSESFDAIHSAEGSKLTDISLAAPRLSFSEDKSLKAGCKFCGSDDAWIVQEEQATSGCKFCGSDDAVTSNFDIEFSAKLGCKFCGSDDAVFAVSEVAINKAWEQLFMAKMIKEGMNPGTCKLVLTDSATA
ncbi:hypothetical protein MPSEU_000140100 [Mayamaea pseudoterrestris]|nr:hypothetical protein MPSEU_000140100 [Mayamaea pseudoterrestris]